MSNPHRIELRKIPIEQQVSVLILKQYELERRIAELQETTKAQAGWINELETRVRKAERKK